MSDFWYYNFLNPDHKMRVDLLRNNNFDWRYLNDIVNTRVSMWHYEGLPGELTSEIIETALMFRNHLCLVKSLGLQEVVLGYYTWSGKMSLYYKPKRVFVKSLAGNVPLGEFDWNDLVLVRDSPMDIIPFICVLEYIDKINNIERAMMLLVEHSALPLVLTGPKKQANALREQAKRLGHKEPFVIGDDEIATDVKQYDIRLLINPLDLYDLKKKYINECTSSLGIYSVEEKRERIVTQELVNQNDYTDFIYNKSNNERKRWVEEANKKFGLSIRMIESYVENLKDGYEEVYETAKAKAKGELDGNPDQFKTEVNDNVQ